MKQYVSTYVLTCGMLFIFMFPALAGQAPTVTTDPKHSYVVHWVGQYHKYLDAGAAANWEEYKKYRSSAIVTSMEERMGKFDRMNELPEMIKNSAEYDKEHNDPDSWDFIKAALLENNSRMIYSITNSKGGTEFLVIMMTNENNIWKVGYVSSVNQNAGPDAPATEQLEQLLEMPKFSLQE